MTKKSIHPRTLEGARRLLVGLAVTALATPLIPAARATPESAPLVYMTTTRRDFGELFAGEVIDQSFPIRNDGDAPLEMEEKPLTGGLAPPPSERLLRAGAFQSGGGRAHALMPAAVRRVAPT